MNEDQQMLYEKMKVYTKQQMIKKKILDAYTWLTIKLKFKKSKN